MNASRLLETALRTLARHPLRSAFLMLGTLVGVAALTLVVSLGRVAERRVLDTVRRNFSPDSIVVTAGTPILVGGPRDDASRLTLDDAEALAAALPAIDTWDPIFSIEDAQVRRGDAVATARVVGSSERAPRVWGRGAAEGAYFDAAAVAASARVAVIGEGTARALFGAEDPLGAEIQVGSVPFRVVGVLEPAGTDAHGNDRDAELAVPITTAMRRVENTDQIRGVRLLLRDPGQVEATAAEVRRLLRERHALSADRADDFTVVTPVFIRKMVGRMQRVFLLFLPLVAAVALLAGAAVAASVSLLSVSERTGELGLRRALGARPRDLFRQLLWETAVTTSAGGVVGAALGIAGTEALARHLHLAGGVSWGAVALGLVLAAATGLAAGVLPARRAARLQVVEALRA
jgi:putative ABC transport system permease protein